MVFVDTNILMYAAGSGHKNKVPSLKLLHDIASRKTDACTSVEVLQEILHRYRIINRWEDGKKVYDLTCSIIPAIYPVELQDLDRCRRYMDSYTGMMARDCLHIGFCVNRGIDTICSYDDDFDGVKELKRITPGEM